MALTEWARQPKVRKRCAVALAVVAVYGLIGFLAVPPLLRSVLTSKLTKALHRPTTVESVAFNPFTLSARVRGLTVREPASPDVFVSLGELYANAKLTSLLHLAPVLKELRLTDLRLRIVRNEDSTYNFSDLLAPAAPPPSGPPKPLRYALNNIQLIGGSVDFDDRPVRKLHTVRNLYIAIPFLSNLPDETDVFVQPALRAVVNGTPFVLEGRTKPFADSRETSLDIDIRDLDVPGYLVYLPVAIPVKLQSARLATQLTLTFRQERGKPSTLVLAGRAALRDVAVTDARGGELLALPLFEVRIAAADLLIGRTSLSSVLLQQPRLRLQRDAMGVWNLAALALASGRGQAAAAKDGGKAAAFILEVAELKVTDGTLLFADATPKPPFEATLHAVELGVRGFSNAPGVAAKVELSLTSDAGETLHHTGEFTFEPLAARGTFELTGAPLRRYAPYYQDAVAFEIADGVLGLSSGYAWSGAEGGGLTLSGLAATLRSLRLRKTGEQADFLAVPEAGLKESSVDLVKSSIVLGDVSLAGARLAVTRGGDGVWNVATLLPAAPVPATALSATLPAGGVMPSPIPAPPTAPAWAFTLKRFALTGAEIAVDDALPAKPVHVAIAPLDLTAQDLSTVEGVKGNLDLRCKVNGSGAVSLRGGIGLNPLAGTLAAEVKQLPLVPLQGYVSDRVRIVVNDGTASASGNLTLASAGAAPSAGFTGRASVDRLATVDADAAEDLLKWDSLAFDGVSFASEPFRLEIGEITLVGLAAHLTVAPDGTANIRRVLGGGPPPPAGEEEEEGEGEGAEAEPAATPTPAPSPTAAPAPAPQPGAPDAVRIGKVTIRDGMVAILDRSVSPDFRMDLTGLTGSVSGLTSLASTAGEVDLRATLNGQAPLSVTGKVNPLAGNLFIDLKIVGSDFDLPAVSTYSGTYAGYAIQRGKMSLELAYKISQRRLEAQNQLVVDQFDFGEKVESPKATHLPVRLAVSLLKDRNERITLNLPVSGSLDDPKFRVGRIILKMIGHLLVKVATSPFALLGSLFGGGGAELNTVVFAPGSAALDDAARGHLDTLAKALYDRPGLRLEVAGRADPTADREGLRQAGLQRAIKREKLDDLVKEGGTAQSLDAVVVKPEEYETYLKRAYKHGKFSKPRNLLGIAKAEPVPEMEKRLLASLEPGADALRQLASSRAGAVQAYLLQTGKVKAEQVFVVAASGAPASAGKAPLTRADLSLK
ncbi:MAG: DUF748 domain-containing protein [Acidobacteriia bacterium]|nr:DUF748 domain-containing protein [Terriglobia bacterium]